jgi:hypothetical protein
MSFLMTKVGLNVFFSIKQSVSHHNIMLLLPCVQVVQCVAEVTFCQAYSSLNYLKISNFGLLALYLCSTQRGLCKFPVEVK